MSVLARARNEVVAINLNAEIATVDGVAIVVVSDLETTEGIKTIRDYAVEVLGFYTSLLGFYPHHHLVIIPGDDFPKGGSRSILGLLGSTALNVCRRRVLTIGSGLLLTK